MTATKETKTAPTTSIIAQPFELANKAFLASLGLASQIQSLFETKLDELAKDGKTLLVKIVG